MTEAAFAAARESVGSIDLTRHAGAHPRFGAVDVIPFVPLRGTPMAVCLAVARALGERLGRELALPVYYYEEAATRPERRDRAQVSMNLTDPDQVSLDRVFALVRGEAARHGVAVLGSELVGALRLDDLLAVARRTLAMPELHRGQVLDAWLPEPGSMAAITASGVAFGIDPVQE